MCVWNNPYPPPFPPPLHICIRSLNSTGPTLPLSCVLPVCIFDSKRCASACLNNTHVFRNGAFSFANVTSCINKKGWMYFRLQRVLFCFFLTLLSHYAVFLLNFGVRIHQGDKWNPFKKKKLTKTERRLLTDASFRSRKVAVKKAGRGWRGVTLLLCKVMAVSILHRSFILLYICF